MTIYYLILDATHEHYDDIRQEFADMHYAHNDGAVMSVLMNNDNSKAEMKVSGDFSGWLPTVDYSWADEPSVLQSFTTAETDLLAIELAKPEWTI